MVKLRIAPQLCFDLANGATPPIQLTYAFPHPHANKMQLYYTNHIGNENHPPKKNNNNKTNKQTNKSKTKQKTNEETKKQTKNKKSK